MSRTITHPVLQTPIMAADWESNDMAVYRYNAGILGFWPELQTDPLTGLPVVVAVAPPPPPAGYPPEVPYGEEYPPGASGGYPIARQLGDESAPDQYPPTAPPPPAPPVPQPPIPATTPVGVQTVVDQSTQISQSPSGMPGSAGSSASGEPVYRFVLESWTPYHRFDTGASYVACTKAQTGPCDAKQFDSLEDALMYAQARREVLYRVLSDTEVWGLIDGTIPLDPSRIISSAPATVGGMDLATVALLAGAAFLLLRK